MQNLLRALVVLPVLCLLAVEPVDAQIWKKVKEAAKRTVEREAVRKTQDVVIEGMAMAGEVVVCMIGDDACIEQAAADGHRVTVQDEEGNEITTAASADVAAAAVASPGDGVWANYDFVPGDRVLFYEDFEDGRTGDFPRRLEFVNGNMEVVEWNGEKLLRATGDHSRFAIQLPENLPERFTIEFEMHDAHGSAGVSVATGEPEGLGWAWTHNYPYSYFNAGHRAGSGVKTFKGFGPTSTLADRTTSEQMRPVRIAVDGSYAKMYIGETRVSNVPNATIARTDKLFFFLEPLPSRQQYVFIDDVRIAAGGRDLYDRLEAEGRVATQGIYFDTGSDRIRPESTATLEEMGAMLEDHPELRLTIEGHTDDVGDDAANQALSERRAAAVRQYLVDRYGVDASRLEAKGMGESVPAADNGTAEGRQQNRRVELVKLG